MLMKTVIHKAESRGHANHGWLDSHHTFSFANYYNPERMNFGVIRVLNDDFVQGGMGFSSHPHNNMEIISIPLEGELEHKDSMGNIHTIKAEDIQVMSAGTGIFHSEYNRNKNAACNFLQVWVFPNEQGLTPRYDQQSINGGAQDEWNQILSPNANDSGVWIHQNAWFHIGKFNPEKRINYPFKSPGNGLYIFVLNGDVTVEGYALLSRDGLGMWDINNMELISNTDAQVLIMEVPMS